MQLVPLRLGAQRAVGVGGGAAAGRNVAAAAVAAAGGGGERGRRRGGRAHASRRAGAVVGVHVWRAGVAASHAAPGWGCVQVESS
jgi:hypothetical protein